MKNRFCDEVILAGKTRKTKIVDYTKLGIWIENDTFRTTDSNQIIAVRVCGNTKCSRPSDDFVLIEVIMKNELNENYVKERYQKTIKTEE